MHRPALVQGRCRVLVGQASRSGGALCYDGFAEFEAAVDLLITEDGLAERLGACGRQYVEANYQWDELSDRYEGLLRRSIEAFGDRSARQVGR